MEYLDRIKKIRLQKGISQKEMSDALGMAQNNYGKIERGLTELSLNRFIEIAKILDVTTDEILLKEPFLGNVMHETIKILEDKIDERNEWIELLNGYLILQNKELNSFIKKLNQFEKDKSLHYEPYPKPPMIKLDGVERLTERDKKDE